jgi:hypothetical protein
MRADRAHLTPTAAATTRTIRTAHPNLPAKPTHATTSGIHNPAHLYFTPLEATVK